MMSAIKPRHILHPKLRGLKIERHGLTLDVLTDLLRNTGKLYVHLEQLREFQKGVSNPWFPEIAVSQFWNSLRLAEMSYGKLPIFQELRRNANNAARDLSEKYGFVLKQP